MSDHSGHIGYKNPPTASRFQPGQSGNLRGRPKGSRNYDNMLQDLLDEQVPRGNSTSRSISRQEALVRSLVDRALDRDRSAVIRVVGLMRLLDTTPEQINRPTSPEEFKKIEAEFDDVMSGRKSL